MSNRWLTKQDILDDLAEVTGGRRVTNIDDRFAVRGCRPPPVIVPDEDQDEIQQMYSKYTSKNNKIEEPDLPGITHMLRMVNDYYDTAKCDDDKNIKELKKSANTVINISKLNPNVPEFYPKSFEKNSNETKNEANNGDSNNSESPGYSGISKSSSEKLDIKHFISEDDDEFDKTDASHNNETNNNDIDVTKKIDVSSLNPNDIKDISEKLKLKIVSTSKDECLAKKRERNLAMASLLKLYTNIPKSPKKDAPLKLMTPEYFQTIPDIPSKSDETGTNQTETEQNIMDEVTKETGNVVKPVPVLNKTDPANESPSSSKTKSQESSELSIDKTSDNNIEKPSNSFLMSKEVAESVKKVDKWLNGPEKKKHKSRAVFFGPVTFKRKETGLMNSSQTQSLSVDVKETPSISQTSKSFVPSTYANELTKTYIERSQSKAVQNEDIWTKLERQLQEKDKAIRERLLSAQVRELQKKWKSLKDYYQRRNPKLDIDQKTKKKKPIVKLLKFLDKVTKSDYQIRAQRRLAERNKIKNQILNLQLPDYKIIVQNCQEMKTPKPRNEIKKKDLDNELPQNEEMKFLYSLLPAMLSLNDRLRFEFKLGVMMLIKKIKYEEEDTQSNTEVTQQNKGLLYYRPAEMDIAPSLTTPSLSCHA